MKRSDRVDHKCIVTTPDKRQWDRLEPTVTSWDGLPLNEIWKCRDCGYEFELPRARKRLATLH